uniref:Homogentisate phytyltransferase n=1 Tax=Physcomitrium patens TaxID=3218 RepID=A0A7I4EEB3_PHYPA
MESLQPVALCLNRRGLVSATQTRRFTAQRKSQFSVTVQSTHEITCFQWGRQKSCSLISDPKLLSLSSSARPLDADDGSSVAKNAGNLIEAVVGWFDALYRFSRPHTIYGSALGVISVSMLAIQSPADISSIFLIGLLQALIPALLMNVYIVGLNQLYDIGIDKVNKPYLPLASGEFSLNTGIAIVTVSAALSLAMGLLVGSEPLLWALGVSFVLGTAYSADIPMLRWKRSAVAAASCILVVRAVVVQLGFYLHMQAFVFSRAAALTRPLCFTMGFMCFFSIVIALAKDIPDVDGDKVFGIRTFSVRMGKKKVFWMCVGLLQAAYASAFIVGVTSTVLWSKIAMGLGHTALATILWYRSRNVDLSSRAAIASWYMFIWKLFYAEYFLIPLMR